MGGGKYVSKHSFAFAVSVDIGGINEIAANFRKAPYDLLGFVPIGAVIKVHRAQAQLAHHNACSAERAVFE
jgi:hypothetical protein